MGQKGIIDDLKALGRDVSLRELMNETHLDLEDIYVNGDASMTKLRKGANVVRLPEEGPTEAALLRSVARLTYVNDLPRIHAWRALVSGDPPQRGSSDPWERLLYVALGQGNRPYAEMPEAWSELWSCPNVRRELLELLDVLEDQIRRRTPPIEGSVLAVHADYSLVSVATKIRVILAVSSVGVRSGSDHA